MKGRKVYILIMYNLCIMHGANMYAYNKVRYVRDRGYEPFVYSVEKGNVFIPGLREFQKYQIEEMRFYPGCLKRSDVDKIIR